MDTETGGAPPTAWGDAPEKIVYFGRVPSPPQGWGRLQFEDPKTKG